MKPMTEKAPNIKKTPTGYIGLDKSMGVKKSCKSTMMSSVIITAPRATSVQTSAAYRGAIGPRVNWKRKATTQIRARSI